MNSKWITDLNVIAKTISLRRKQRYKYHNLEFGNGFLVMMLKAKKKEKKTAHIFNFFKIRNVWASKDIISIM